MTGSRKILAAIMDVVHVKKLITRGFNKDFEQYRITKIKKFLVYDPSKVAGWDIEKKLEE